MRLAGALLVVCLSGVILARTTSDRILNGADSALGDHPYAVAIADEYDNVICGGFVYNQRFVVTAASCVYDVRSTPALITVVAGKVSFDISDSNNGQRLRVNGIYVHDDYEATTKTNDIALLETVGAIKYDENVGSAYYDEVDKNGATATVMGWGIGNDIQSRPSSTLKRATVSLNADCSTITGFDDVYMICAGDDNTGPCTFDEGAPLVQNSYIVGIMSRRPERCSPPLTPATYTRLSSYYVWLTQTAGPQS